MNFIRSLANYFRKDDPSRVLISVTNSGPVVTLPKNYESFSKEGYAKCAVVFKSISLVSQGAAGIEWTLYKKPTSRKGKRVQIDNHKFLDLMKRPNPMQGGSAFMEAVHAYKLLTGNSYISAIGPRPNVLEEIRELWPMRPDRVVIKPGVRGFPAAYVYKLNGQSVVYTVDQVKLKSPVLHLFTFNPTNDWYGLSPIEPGSFGIDQHNASNKWNLSLLQNSARPSGILVASVTDKSNGMLTDTQFNRLKEQIHENYVGERNAGKPMLLEGGLDWKQISLTNQQMEFIENKQTSARDIAMVFGVPSQLLGIPGDSTYSNYQEARAALYEETILPAMNYTRDEFNNWLLPTYNESGLVADYDKDEIHALAGRRQQVWDKISGSTFLTVNEKREATGYEPVENGDEILVNSTQITLDQVISDGESAEDGDQTGDDLGNDQNLNPDPTPQPDKTPSDSDQEDEDPKGLFEVKLINLPDARAKLREWRGQQRLRKKFEKRLQRQAHATFEVEGHKVSDAVDGLDLRHAEIVVGHEINANHEQWKRILTMNMEATAKAFKDRFGNAVKSYSGSIETKDEEDSAYDEAMRSFIRDHVGTRVTQISETSKKRVISAMRDAQEEAFDAGTPITSYAAAVKEAYEGFSEDRAMTIARTETGTAAMTSLSEAAKASNIPGLQKEWVATQDGRTREDHADVDGQVVGLDDDFTVGGAKMAQPLDPDGPPEEVINCRCAMVFARGEDDDT